jgi:GLPGLI family protein
MKKIIHFTLLLTIVSGLLFSFTTQQKIQEGLIEFDITFLDLSPEMKQAEAMLPKKVDIYFKGENSRTEMPSGMGNTITIRNRKKKEFYVLMDMMGQKMAVKQTDAEMEIQRKKMAISDISVEELDESKIIAGYKCKRAKLTFTLDGKTETVDCFYCPELSMVDQGNNNPAFSQIKGMMMEYSMSMGGIKAKISATKVSTQKVEDKMFEIPSDYTIRTIEELGNMGQE